MKQFGLGAAGVICLLFQLSVVAADNSLDILEQDLNQLKHDHQQAATETLASFLSQLDTAAQSPDAAIDLYQKAGGNMPAPTPATPRSAVETPEERTAREAQDAQNAANLAMVVQLHCAMMRFGALFINTPDQKGLQDDWVNWLKSAAQVYPQIKIADPQADDTTEHKGKRSAKETVALIRDFKGMPLKGSIISKYLGFQGWGDKDQGNWAVAGVPDLYRAAVLEPLRARPSSDTLAAWDVYIAMKNADQPDPDRWTQVDYPSLQFDRGCDDYAITHSMDKLQALIEIIKANPTHPKLEDMIARAHGLVEDYRGQHASATPVAQVSTPAPAPAPTDPNVTVTTTTQGDMTIVTTHSNAAPTNPVPPSPPAP